MYLRVVAIVCLLFVFGLILTGCGGGSSTSPHVMPPAITSHPSSQTVVPGQAATFTVAATGSAPLRYQWQKDGTAIPDGTSASYNTPPATASDDGSQFKVVVSNHAGSALSNPATLMVNGGDVGNVSVTISPKRAAVAMTAQTQQFTATVSGDPQNRGVTWTVDGVTGGNATVGSISSSGLYAPPPSGGTHTIVATSIANTAQSASATIAVTDLPGVFTYHNNLMRDGTNTLEYGLTSSSVNTTTFGKLFSCPTDGNVYAQPLWVSNLGINGATHNVVFVATQHDSIYAFDADASPCAQMWKANLLDAAHGGSAAETSVPTGDVGSGFQDIQPEIGVTGTPVIDPASNTIYVVSKSEGPAGNFHQRLHALDLATGNERFGGPVVISASVSGNGDGSTGGNLPFNAQTENQRCALALVNGVVYIAWASHEDADPYHGWVIGYNAATLARAAVFNATANGSRAGIWMSGGAPAADTSGNLFLSTGNGTFDATSATSPNNDFGDSILKISPSLAVADWFTPFNQSTLESNDLDLGSGGILLLPDQSSGPAHLLVTGGKEGKLYLLNRDGLGEFCSNCTTTDTNILQSFAASNLIFGTPAFWQNGLYFAGVSDKLSLFAFDISSGKFGTTPTSQSSLTYPFPGATPSISSQGASNGIVWTIDSSQYGVPGSRGLGPAVLHAYDATTLATELWNSSQAANNRDQAGEAVKFTVPTVANGRVYIGTRSTIEVYGLRPD
jgi:Immunoglobulin domain